MRERNWTCEVSYDGKEPFLFYSPAFYVSAEGELHAERLLQDLVNTEFAKISHHPPPKVLSVLPGRLEFHKE
jgi:hypothetical protein